MKIKVCGMRDPENIHAVKELGIDFLGLIFWPKSSRYVKDITVRAGNIPDIPIELGMKNGPERHPATVGVFVNEMPQTVVTHAYNYKLDYIQLHGEESPTYIDNLKRTLIPDIMPDIKVIKALSIREADDVKRWRQYKDHTDLILFDTKCDCVGGSGKQFDWSVLEGYDGDIPFLLSGGIGPEDAESVRRFSHPMCIGIDINSRFETAPAMKDISKLRTFINEIQQ
ncbi:MAG: phosphoribosylanthranilate isomerase [Prevotella sp.]|nr:phosphoribosylanthranilate isomerase [Prevotella sp.]